MFFRLTAVGMFFPSLVAVLASPASHVVLADAGPEAPVPRIRLADRQQGAPSAAADGLELSVAFSLVARPDFGAMGSGPRQAGTGALRIEARIVAGKGNPYGLPPGSRVEGLALAAVVRRSGDGEIWTNPLMEWIPCRGGPHYEATFVLGRPGLYEVTVEPLAPNEEPAVGVANREAAIRLSNGEEPVGFSNGGPAVGV